MKTVDLAQWDFQHIALNQAFLGLISSNVRMIWIDRDDEWVIQIILSEEDIGDREDIDDAIAQFEAFQERALAFRSEIIVKSGKLTWPDAPARVIFRRREQDL